jgi:hypothetical protein
MVTDTAHARQSGLASLWRREIGLDINALLSMAAASSSAGLATAAGPLDVRCRAKVACGRMRGL